MCREALRSDAAKHNSRRQGVGPGQSCHFSMRCRSKWDTRPMVLQHAIRTMHCFAGDTGLSKLDA